MGIAVMPPPAGRRNPGGHEGGRPAATEQVILDAAMTRLQDWGTLLAGLYAALSPIWVNTTGERDAYWALIALGALLAVTALFSLAMPGVVATEWLTVLFGALLFVAPWVLTYRPGRRLVDLVGRRGDRGGAWRLLAVDQRPDAPAGHSALAGGRLGGAGPLGLAPLPCNEVTAVEVSGSMSRSHAVQPAVRRLPRVQL